MSRDSSCFVFRAEIVSIVHKFRDVRIILVEAKLEVLFATKPFVEEVCCGLMDCGRVLRETSFYLDAVESESFIHPGHHLQELA